MVLVMLKVIETFSGIGAQAKALRNIGCEFEIIGTADWDINAIIAYDLIHNGKQDLSKYKNATREELLDKLSTYTLSSDGKSAADEITVKRQSLATLCRVCAAIDRTNNYVSVTDMKGDLLPDDLDALTYSFPCQDLSVAHAWHGKTDGIDRSAANRSSMLWEIERILKERKASEKPMPKFLLMENVPNIISRSHSKNFEEWKQSLNDLGYYNKLYCLNAKNFGIPQNRRRAYMISIRTDGDRELEHRLDVYFEENNLELVSKTPRKLKEFLRDDYSDSALRQEANNSQPNDTPSRRDIFKKNTKLFNGESYIDIVPTITTKQDRHPNSGVIVYRKRPMKCNYRYLTPRECLLLMGFDDEDYEAIIEGDFMKDISHNFFTGNKIVKMAGNSIVVPVLEEVFKQMIYINDNLLPQIHTASKEAIYELRGLNEMSLVAL
jgi:DNA (cytosine-5)-methyltransferase 1